MAKRKLPLHQGLIKMVVCFMWEKDRYKKCGTSRKSGFSISQTQILLGVGWKGNESTKGKEM